MPHCFALYRKGENTITELQVVDDELREHLGLEPSETDWAYGWYNTIGLLLAIGKSFGEIKKLYADEPPALEVIDFLDRNFNVQSWREHGRRN